MRLFFLFVFVLFSCVSNYDLGDEFSLERDDITGSFTIYYRYEGFLNDEVEFYCINGRNIFLKDVNGKIIVINKDRFIKGYGTLKLEMESILRFENDEIANQYFKISINWIQVDVHKKSQRL